MSDFIFKASILVAFITACAGTAHAQISHGMDYKQELLPVIEVIDEHFEIPQLIKTRRIAAILPHNYHHTDKRYPVLYLQDGQNLFDDHAPFGSWEVPRKLAWLAERGMGDVIIISIDHAESERLAEFTPSRETQLGIGDGQQYARFLAETLKPYVDAHFRTLPEREHTGIGGSSMGALISIYATMQFPMVYSKLLIFSPSLWVSPELSEEFVRDTPTYYGRIYLYGGTAEGGDMVEHLTRLYGLVKENPHGRNLPVELSVREGGEHNEAAWGQEFPRAIAWLYFQDL
ncbi:MAG: putative hydrolase of the alpha/beta superfamily [Bacteroidetes bacterium HLUCCA01]|nr:MAG: putative hydrolase of the alpha/beta superfamily [Bacteroidetes bacterium HLUCCA01]